MIVTHSDIHDVVRTLSGEARLSLDTETTGLRAYHGDRLFSLILATPTEQYYFNFQEYPGVETLPRSYLRLLDPVFQNPAISWDLFNAKFDMRMLAREGVWLVGEVHCGKAIALLEYNEHMSYSLEACAARIGHKKSDAVEEYIEKHKLWEWTVIPGKKARGKRKFFNKVPFEVIAPYGEIDAKITLELGEHQRRVINDIDNSTPRHLSSIKGVFENEKRLTKTVFKMEHLGVKIDRAYCIRAERYEYDRLGKLEESFKRETGKSYSSSGKLFQEIFAAERDRWVRTKPTKTRPEGGWSFESAVLQNFKDPVAKIILQLRDAKSKSDFYNGFLYHADENDFVHPTLSPDGAGHGRFSSSDPNFQNLTSEEGLESEFVVRRAIISPPGFIMIMPDYDQMEYRLMLDYAAKRVGYATSIVQKVLGGLDVHTATAQTATEYGTPITRDQAKTTNFLSIYGGGDQKLADGLKCTLEQAKAIRKAIFDAAPELKSLTRDLMNVAEQRGYVFNWFGRRCHFPDQNFAYRAPNYVIAGGCADVVKIAMNRIDDYCQGKKSRLALTIHDELPMYIHESEVLEVPKRVDEIMQTVYPHKFVPLTTSMEWSDKSLGDKKKGYPV